MEQKKTTGHSLTLCDREKLTLTGVTDVDAFNEEEITVITDFGELTVKGELLHVEALDLECFMMCCGFGVACGGAGERHF